MTRQKHDPRHPATSVADQIRNAWFILAAIAGLIYWAAKHDSSLADIKENRTKIAMLENRMIVLENGLDKLTVKIDGIKEDLSLIKTAVLK